LVSPKIHPSKIFEPRKFFPRSHFFANKNFSLFKQKISAKSFALSTPESVPVGQSILTDESADMIFSSRKKIMISRLLATVSL
jgi:hypothetical protein